MYVPVDEALKDQGEVNMAYQIERSGKGGPRSTPPSSEGFSQASTATPDYTHLAVGSVNPIYQR